MTAAPRFGGFPRFGMDVAMWWVKGIKKMAIDSKEMNTHLLEKRKNGMKTMAESPSNRHKEIGK